MVLAHSQDAAICVLHSHMIQSFKIEPTHEVIEDIYVLWWIELYDIDSVYLSTLNLIKGPLEEFTNIYLSVLVVINTP